ncbi:MAG TPA: thiamine phosphate synthase [Pyrinomonadaceae bacterium]|jgi:thiamine-phosphate pyrophosphorylase
MSFQLPKLYAITDTRISGLSHAYQVRAFCEGGATLIQLREKCLLPDDFYREAKVALDVARDYDVTVLINDRVDLALAVGADGVHLGQDDLSPNEARSLLGPEAIIGLSTHNADQARASIALPIDYLAIGPIFSTTSKEKPDPVVGLTGIREVRKITAGRPLVAIGGITLETAVDVLAAGADSVALIGWLLQDSQAISARTRQLLAMT